MPAKSLHSFSTELALDNGTVPTRINLLPPSGFTGRDGRGPFNYEFTALLAAFSANGMPVSLDYDHQSETASDKSGPVPASGWVTALDYDPATGVWATVEWTADASARIAAREYRGFSPVFSVEVTSGRILEIIGGGLTNRPNLHLILLNSRSDGYTGDTHTSENSPVLEKLLAILGLPADTSEDAATAALATLKASADKSTALDAAALAAGITDTLEPATVVESLNTRSQVVAGAFVPKETFEAMSLRATTAETELVAMRKAHAEAELSAVLDAAKTAGKLTPAQVAHARALGERDLGSLKALLEATAPVVNTSATATPADSSTAVATHTVKLTAEQKRLATLKGLSEAEYAAALQTK